MEAQTGKTVSAATVKSAMRTLDILELLVRSRRPMPAHEIAEALAIPVSSLSYLLTTLVEREYLVRTGRQYALGPAVARLRQEGAAPALKDQVTPIVRSLNAQLNETAGFFVLRDMEIEAIASEIGLHALRYTLDVGQRAPLHAFSAGKALLATFDEDRLAHYFAHMKPMAFTDNTLTSEAALRAEIAQIRQKGFARTNGEHTPGIIGLGRAVVVDGTPVGAFSVAIPSPRFNDEVAGRVAALLIRAADMLGTSLAHGNGAAGITATA